MRTLITWPTLKRFLRSPRLIVAEIVALTLAGILGASWPQPSATLAGITVLQNGRPSGLQLVTWLGLNHVFRTPWFMAIILLCTASLLVVVCGQLRRLRISWSAELGIAHFRGAPLQAEFVRPLRLPRPGNRCRVWTENRIGSAGSALFHLGLLLVILAGGWRALFGAEAVVDLVEGETLQPSAAVWAAQWPGLLAKPMALSQPVTLTGVRPTCYPSGDLRNLEVHLACSAPDGLREARLGVNRDLHLRGGRLLLGHDFGPAALIEWQRTSARPTVNAALLGASSVHEFEGSALGPDQEKAFFRARLDTLGNHADSLEVRVLKHDALIYTGEAQPGDTLLLRNGDRLVLRGLPFWVRIRGSRDSALWLAYAGFALLLTGAVLLFAVIRLDLCVAVTSEGDRERVFVALRPHRFAPLFQERFRQLLREEAAPNSFAHWNHEPARLLPLMRGQSASGRCSLHGFLTSEARVKVRRTGMFIAIEHKQTDSSDRSEMCRGRARSTRTFRSYRSLSRSWGRYYKHSGPTDLCREQELEDPCKVQSGRAHSKTWRLIYGLGCLSAATLLVFTSCGPSPSEQARRLVERYNAVVSEAYRRGDVKLIDSVVGPNEGKKITGLIGVRLDLGLTLDSHLTALEILGLEEKNDQMRVRTKECWHYRDLKIGSGEQVGEASLDTYEMLYVFKRKDRSWLVDEIQFTAEPQVGRKITPWLSHRNPASENPKLAPAKAPPTS